jgi:hypothetical protein
MDPVLREITSTLRSGNSVWFVGNLAILPAEQLPPPELQTKWWLGSYLYRWNTQVTAHLLDHVLQEQVLEIPVDAPVNCFENLSVVRFSGYRPEAD